MPATQSRRDFVARRERKLREARAWEKAARIARMLRHERRRRRRLLHRDAITHASRHTRCVKRSGSLFSAAVPKNKIKRSAINQRATIHGQKYLQVHRTTLARPKIRALNNEPAVVVVPIQNARCTTRTHDQRDFHARFPRVTYALRIFAAVRYRASPLNYAAHATRVTRRRFRMGVVRGVT